MVIIGLIPIVCFFKDRKILNFSIYTFIFFLSFTWYGGAHNHSHNRYEEYSKSSHNFSKINFFRFQILPNNYNDFYEEFLTSVNKLNDEYVLNKNYNFSGMPILGLLSNTLSYQITTYNDLTIGKFYLERKDINLEYAFKNFNDLKVFYPSNNEITNLDIKNNFSIYKKIEYPIENFKYLFILIPNNVILKNK